MTLTRKADGEWVEGKATPELLPERLRELPAELVTKDGDDEARVHADDPEHIVGALVHDYNKAHSDQPQTPPDAARVAGQLRRIPLGESAPLTQERIDVEKFHAIRGILGTYLARAERGETVEVGALWHLWFETNNVNDLKLRPGAAPPDCERPRHMRNFDLTIDPLCPPQSVRDKCAAAGFAIRNARAQIEEARRQQRQSDSHRLVELAMMDEVPPEMLL